MLRNLKGEPAHLTEEDWGNQESLYTISVPILQNAIEQMLLT